MSYVLYCLIFEKTQENIYLLRLANVKTKRKDARHIHGTKGDYEKSIL